MSMLITGVRNVYKGTMGTGEALSNLTEGTSSITSFATKITGTVFGTLKKVLGGGDDRPRRRSARLAEKEKKTRSLRATKSPSPKVRRIAKKSSPRKSPTKKHRTIHTKY